MTTPSDIHDPAMIDPTRIQPKPELGANFETKAFPALLFSTKSQIWGDKSASAIEPTVPEYLSQELRKKTGSKDYHCCMFCGFFSQNNQVHNLTDNHLDIREANLRTVDPLCHSWQHLGELGEGNAVIAYLPGLSGQDINHLQRTILIALESADAKLRDDAKKLLNWMASHRDYTKEAWGTDNPSVFASALVRLEENEREKREVAFQDLAVIFNPGLFGSFARLWVRESYGIFVRFPHRNNEC